MNHLFRRRLGHIIGAVVILLTGCTGERQPEPVDHHEEHGAMEDQSIVHLDKHKVLHAGIRIEPVAKRSIPIPLTLPGRVTFNERRLADVTARLGGRVESINSFTNDSVRESEVVLQLYSQDFLSLQFEFLQGVKRLEQSGSAAADELNSAKALHESARGKLLLTGMSDADLDVLASSQKPSPLYDVRAPFAGIILTSTVRAGEFVEIGSDLFELADLRTLWVLADISENDLRYVQRGMKAEIQVAAYPGSWSGSVTSVYHVMDEKTRTVKARIEVDNANGKLKPEMFCTVDIQTALGKETIKIPAGALLGETERHFVFVALNDTTFEKRDVRTGAETREFAEILDGLLEQERIVVKGGFFLKSELAKETFSEDH